MKLPTLTVIGMLISAHLVCAADDVKLTLAREVIQAMHADKMFDSMSAQMQQMAALSVPAVGTPEQQAHAKQIQAKIMALSLESAKATLSKMDSIYADVYSEAELKAMKAFFTSPEGQSMLQKQPQIMQRMMPLIQEMQRDLRPKIMQLIQEEKTEGATGAASKATPPASSSSH